MANSVKFDAQVVMSKNIPYLDGWRGIAIVCVLVAHLFGVDWLGGLGVSIFFVLSGLLMSRILFIDRMTLGVFFLRRAARILPAFVVFIVLTFLIWSVRWAEFTWEELFSTIVFLRTYFPGSAILQSEYPIGHIWSLNVEEHCYVVMAIAAFIWGKYGGALGGRILLGLAALCVVFFVYYKFHPPLSPSLFTQRSEVAAFPLFLSASLLLLFRAKNNREWPLTSILALACAFLVAGLSSSIFFSFVASNALLAISINKLNKSPDWFLTCLSNPLLRWFGVHSFSIYLWQQWFYYLGRSPVEFVPHWVISIAATLVLAKISYDWVERPMRARIIGWGRGQ